MVDEVAIDVLNALEACRCCLEREPARNLVRPYVHLGKTEIYLSMLKECLDIRLDLDSKERGICETCVGRLRDASEFKLQVRRSQKELKAKLKRALEIINNEPVVKTETDDIEDETSTNLLDNAVESDMADDDGANNSDTLDNAVESDMADGDGANNSDKSDNAVEPDMADDDGANNSDKSDNAVESDMADGDGANNSDKSDEQSSDKPKVPNDHDAISHEQPSDKPAVSNDDDAISHEQPSDKPEASNHDAISRVIVTELKEIKSFVTYIMRKVEAIEISLTRINVPSEPKPTLLPKLPLKQIKELENMEAMLGDDNVRMQLFDVLRHTGGSKERDCVNRCLEKIFSDYLGQYCSWTGKKNNFKLSSLILMDVIKRAVRQTFPNVTDESFVRHVMNWFQHAGTRLKRH